MSGHFHELKGQMNHMREGERARLTKLTLESNQTLKALKKCAEKVCVYIYLVILMTNHKIVTGSLNVYEMHDQFYWELESAFCLEKFNKKF